MWQLLALGVQLANVFALFASPAPALAQDTIRYLDRKAQKELTAAGTIEEESPGAVVYRSGAAAGTREIPALDIVDITYDLPPAIKLSYRSAISDERRAADPAAKDADRRKSLSDALKEYQEILPRLEEAKLKFAERHVHYKIARLRARQAEDSPEQMDAALEALGNYLKQYPDGWQTGQAARMLARLQLARGDAAAAEKTYEELAATPKIPAALRHECDLLVADALIQGKNFAAAQKKLTTLLKGVPADDPQATRLQILLSVCLGVSGKLPEAVAQLEGVINKTADRDLKALAYNALGDCYRLNGKSREALWPYLWVDVIYHQDKQEHLKAMEQLAKLFDDLGEKSRAKQYRDRLKKELR